MEFPEIVESMKSKLLKWVASCNESMQGKDY
jgi:hypothetical protein